MTGRFIAPNVLPIETEGVSLASTFTESARKLGVISAFGFALLCLVYAVTLVVGFLSLQSAQEPIGDPLFSILEVLIIVMAPLMVVMIATARWLLPDRTPARSDLGDESAREFSIWMRVNLSTNSAPVPLSWLGSARCPTIAFVV